MRLPDPERSYAVLIGTASYRSPELTDLPAVTNNLDELAAVLTDPALGGLPAERCIVVHDPADVRTVYRTLRRYATATEDTLLVYFAGHGRISPLRNELYLSLTDTDPDELPVTALRFDLVREAFADSPAVNRVLILDCCFSGRAIPDMSGSDDAVIGQVGIEGTYTLTATLGNEVALAPAGAPHTAFTGELLTLLRAGIPDGPELLTYAAIYPRLVRAMALRAFPRPRQCGTGTVDQLALARNASHASRRSSAPPRQPRRLEVHGKKGWAAFNFPIFVGGGIFFAMKVFFVLASYPWDPGETTGAVIRISAFTIIAAVFLAVGASLGSALFRPFEFHADDEGFEFTRAGRRVFYRWTDVDRIWTGSP